MWLLAAPALAGGWSLGFARNDCDAVTELPDGGRLRVHLTRWDDLSDSVIVWRPGLPPLWDEPESGLVTGRTPAEVDADAADGFGLGWRLGATRSTGNVGFHSMLVDLPGMPGAAYRVGVEQDLFLEALRAGGELALLRRDEVLVAVAVEDGPRLAKKLGACVRKDPR